MSDQVSITANIIYPNLADLEEGERALQEGAFGYELNNRKAFLYVGTVDGNQPFRADDITFEQLADEVKTIINDYEERISKLEAAQPGYITVSSVEELNNTTAEDGTIAIIDSRGE